MSEKNATSKPKWPVISQVEYDEQLKTPWPAPDAAGDGPVSETFGSFDARAPERVADMMDTDELFWHASMGNENAKEELAHRKGGE